MKKILALITTALLLTGCATSTSSNSGYSADDIMFAEMMIPHHEQAIEMSEIAFENTSNPQVLQLAQEIKSAQSPEIELMKSWPGVKTSSHAGHAMQGMLSEDELDELRTAQGTVFDQLFLQGMVKHHEGAIDMAQMIINSKNIDVAKLGAQIITAQKSEITRMRKLLIQG